MSLMLLIKKRFILVLKCFSMTYTSIMKHEMSTVDPDCEKTIAKKRKKSWISYM